MTKISVAWLGVLAVVGIVIFFSYQIALAAAAGQTTGVSQHTVKTVRFAPEAIDADATGSRANGSPVVPPKAPASLPEVPGQTAEDLQMDEPLRATPPATHYEAPEPTDPLKGVAFQDAEFGSNLRHPEQMIERRPKPTMAGAVASGLASARSSPGGNNAQGYSSEMVQNGGDFMGAVLAFDGSEVGTSYSLL